MTLRVESQTPRRRWYVKLALLALSASLLSLAFAPFKQSYLAWVTFAPMLMVWMDAKSPLRAAGWGWCGGAMFFGVNLSYLALNTVAGAAALVAFEALFWALAAAVIRAAAGFERPLVHAAAIACSWVAFDWLRGNTLFALPWLYLGYSQSPAIVLCQIADFAGVYGVTFCVVLINALIAVTWRDFGTSKRATIRAWAAAAVVLCAVAVYGFYRLTERQTSPGPRVLVVQPNDPMAAGGSKSVTQEQSLQFHLAATLDALTSPASQPVDLIAWSETTMPPLNQEARDALRTYPSGQFLEKVHSALRGVTATADAALIAGGYYVGGWEQSGGKRGTDIRNTAFFYDRSGKQEGRYDKIHLVPFGEFTPFRDGLPVLHRLFRRFRPNDEGYTLTSGDAAGGLTVFTLVSRDGQSSRFVAPICFDDIDAPLMARMFRGTGGGKRADFIVNLTNDGWFRWLEPQQHLQAALFRSIENRAPTARAVNTGVSGFIDSCGRVNAILPVKTTGTLTYTLMLDPRMSFYTRFGDVFAFACLIICGGVIVWAVIGGLKGRART
jgi:apolipoprotein N-acyltransferase